MTILSKRISLSALQHSSPSISPSPFIQNKVRPPPRTADIMSSTEITQTSSRPPANTRFFTRRVIFACGHTTERIYPIRDLRGPSFKTARPLVPMLLALRLPDKCIPCVRKAVYDRCRDNAKEMRAIMDALHARLDRILTKADDDAEKELLQSSLELDASENEADELWPNAPPAIESLIKHGADADDSGYYSSEEASTTTTTLKKPRPVGKLSVNIRLLRQDLERRMQAWNRKDKTITIDFKSDSGSDSKLLEAATLSAKDLDDMSSYEALEAEVGAFTVV